MNKPNIRWKRWALAIAALAAIPALAVPQATGTGYSVSNPHLLKSEHNVLRGLTPDFTDSDHSWYNEGNYYEAQATDFGCLTDGAIPDAAKEDATARALISRGAKLTWTWSDSCSIDMIRIFTKWPDGYRNDVSVQSIEVKIGDNWQTLQNSSFCYARRESLNTIPTYNHELTHRVVTFEDSEGANLAEGITGLRITFGDQSGLDEWTDDNTICYGCYWEIEAKNADAEIAPPVISAPDSVTLLHPKSYGLRTIIPEELYDSITDSYGIKSAAVSPSLLGPSGGDVVLTVENNIGITAQKTVAVSFKDGFGDLPHGWITQFLHLGAKFATDDPAYNGIGVDLLSAFGGQANMRPYCGQVLSPIATSSGCSTPGSLTWTPIERIRENGDWRPDESSNDGRNEYNKYWHVYVVSPDSVEREIQFLHSNDDDLRVWVNGNLQVSHGGASHNFTTKGTLYPGVNSIMIRLREGGGGDYMAIAIRKPDGTYFDDLTYSLDPPDEFNLACVASGSADWTGSATVGIAKFPLVNGATKCQITFSTSSSSINESAWVDYTYGENPYTTVTFPSAMATPGASMQCYAWFKIGDDLRSVESTPIKFSDSAPTLELHTAVLDAHAEGGHVVDPYELISSVSGGESGLYKVWSEPTAVTADGVLRIHAMNMAGLEVVKSVSYIVDRLETCLVVPDEFDAPVSGTAKVSSSTASVRVQYAAEGATKTNKFNIAFGDIVDGIGEFSGSIRNLEAGGTYHWIVEVIDGGSVVGSRKGSFTTYLAEKHGSVKTICADLKTIDDDVILTYNGWGKVEFKHSVAASVLLVGGGGGGGVWVGGGGGGGGVVYRENVVIPAGKYVINVGEGGVGASWDGKVAAANGGDSYIDGLQTRGFLAYGGGAGGGSGYTLDDGQYFWGGTNAGADGGSGGGASGHAYADGTLIGEGLPEQGHDGGTAVVEGYAGGGGGAGAVGGAGNANDSGIGGAGGDGIACTITGAEVYYGGGGGGGCGTYGGTDKQSAGGLGGGGKGGYLNSGNNGAVPGTDGEDGLGGGGGGAGKAFAYNNQQGGHGGGHGGRGVVIIRFTQKFSDGSHKATGGNEVLKVPGVGCTYMVHIFTEDGTFELPDSAKIDVFMVGGGGAGGSGYLCGGGGGGAGGVIRREGLEVIEGVYDVVVGAGGVAKDYWAADNVNAKGKSSTFDGLEAFGGGGGGSLYTGGGAGVAGGSGGGAAGGGHDYVNSQSAGGAGVEGQGNAGGANRYDDYESYANGVQWIGAGGGGAGAVGGRPGDVQVEGKYACGYGGDGVMCDWTGEEVWYAGGGGGGNHDWYHAAQGLGGKGGGGNGGLVWNSEATAGAANTGGGGGGGYMDNGNRGKDGGDGGSGIVIIRYKLNPERFKLTIR